jgi:2Fe-2S ferredoxin
MTSIKVQPSDIVFEANAGETIMGAALARGLYWPTTCGGQGICTTCLTEIVSGAESLVEMGRSERKTLVAERGEAILAKPVRLACQTAVIANGVVVVNKPGVRPADESSL